MIRSAYSKWPDYNLRLREGIARLTDDQLLLKPSAERWPLWATIGHQLCQRVFWLCDFAGEPGADTTRFTNAAYNCPGDDDLDNVLNVEQLIEAVDSTFRIIDGCLDGWTFESLEEVLSRPEWGDDRVHARGWVIQRVFSHDVYHIAEVNEILAANGLRPGRPLGLKAILVCAPRSGTGRRHLASAAELAQAMTAELDPLPQRGDSCFRGIACYGLPAFWP